MEVLKVLFNIDEYIEDFQVPMVNATILESYAIPTSKIHN